MTTTTTQNRMRAGTSIFTWSTALGLALASLVYFLDIMIRASHKALWADELITYYLCRLPTFRDTWAGVTHAIDYNPPLFYVLTRGAERLFGEGLIAIRLPAMIGVWLFCVCLFVFVARRAGNIAGFIAGIFPFFTLIHYYSYEARPHGVTLGWCGLALVCWQMAGEHRARFLWLAGFALSLEAALLTHVYAAFLIMPFFAVAIVDLLRTRKTDWGVVIAAVVALAAAVPIYLVLIRSYVSAVPHPKLAVGPQDFVQSFFVKAMGPSIVVLLLSVMAFAVYRNWEGGRLALPTCIPLREFLLAGFFALTPFVAVAGVEISHGPFFARYILSSVAGYAIFLGYANSRSHARSWVPVALALSLAFLMLGDLVWAIRHTRPGGNFALREPSSDFPFNSDPHRPLANFPLLTRPGGNEDILVLEQLDYIYLFRYAPPALVSRLYFGASSPDEMFYGVYGRMGKWAHLDMKSTLFEPFFQTHRKFLVYETTTQPPLCGECMENFLQAGYELKSVHQNGDSSLLEYEKP